MDTPKLHPDLADLFALAPEDFGEALARLMPERLPTTTPPSMPCSSTVARGALPPSITMYSCRGWSLIARRPGSSSAAHGRGR